MAPVHTAAERGDLQHVLELIQDNESNVNLKNSAPPSNADHFVTPPKNFAVSFGLLQFTYALVGTFRCSHSG